MTMRVSGLSERNMSGLGYVCFVGHHAPTSECVVSTIGAITVSEWRGSGRNTAASGCARSAERRDPRRDCSVSGIGARSVSG